MGQFTSLGGPFIGSPAVVGLGKSDETLIVLTVGPDSSLWYARLDGFTFSDDPDVQGTWSTWQSLGGLLTSPPHAVRSQTSAIDVFARGPYSELLHWHFENGRWSQWPAQSANAPPVLEAAAAGPLVGPGLYGFYRNWESLGGALISPRHATVFGGPGGLVTVFAVGTDHALWNRTHEGGWRPWDSWGHTLTSPPYAVAGHETVMVFARGTDSAVWYNQDGTGWHSLGGRFSSAPCGVATIGDDLTPEATIHVFATDENSVLQHRMWNGNSWSDWDSLGGTCMSAPTAWAFNDIIHVYVLGTDSAVWRRRWEGSSWFDWHSLDGTFLAPPAAVMRIDQGLAAPDLVALGTDNAIWYMQEDDA
jgi:hypothetical protein